MDVNLQHEDLLIKLRAKLNEDKIKLWEPPYLVPDAEISQSLQDLGRKYATVFTVNDDTVISALRELQLHSIDRSKANAQFKETGFATLRVRATVPGEKPKNFKVEKKLDVMGSDLITSVANEIEIDEGRLKLIYNGKVIKQTPSLDAQGIRNGAQIMALVMAESVEESKREDRMYMEMKSTMDDAALLSEYVDDLGQDDYMRLEDQSGKTVELPTEERRSLMIGLTLHERGRAAVRQKDYTLALVLFLEADRQLSECRSSLLKSVDNWAVLQLDISWCYLCLQNLSNCADAALRLDRAQNAFRETYGDRQQRLIALKGTAANERVLFMRLYLLQGIVAYHQNKRSEARSFLENAEQELNALRVDDNAVATLIQLGWTAKQAREGLRAAHGDINSANNILTQRSRDRDKHRTDRQQRLLGTCLDGNPINRQLLDRLMERGHSYKVSAMAARDANNNEAVAVALLTEHGHLYADSEESSAEVESSGSDGSHVEPDNKLVAELEAMGYCTEDAKTALKVSKNNLHEAIDVLVAGSLNTVPDSNNTENPSTSRGTEISPQRKRSKKDKKKREREQALRRLKSSIKADEDDYLDSQLADEELFLTQYMSLL